MRFHSPPPFFWPWDSRSVLRDSGRAGDLEYLGGAQGFSYKTCHVADREGFATWENQGWVTWVSSVCPVVLSVSRQIISKLYSRLTSGNISTSYYSFLAHYLSHRSNFSSLSSSIVLIFEFNKLFFSNENNANYLEVYIHIWNIRSMQSPIFGVFV